jgi:hypothetical protein
MRLPSIGGFYLSRIRMDVVSMPKFDLVLGANWVAATHATVTADGLAEPSEDNLSCLQPGHSWVPFPKLPLSIGAE